MACDAGVDAGGEMFGTTGALLATWTCATTVLVAEVAVVVVVGGGGGGGNWSIGRDGGVGNRSILRNWLGEATMVILRCVSTCCRRRISADVAGKDLTRGEVSMLLARICSCSCVASYSTMVLLVKPMATVACGATLATARHRIPCAPQRLASS
jgi:hypothetical protein